MSNAALDPPADAEFVPTEFISQQVFMHSFCKSPFPRKPVNLSYIITNIKNKITYLCGNWVLRNDFINTCCKKRVCHSASVVAEQRERVID